MLRRFGGAPLEMERSPSLLCILGLLAHLGVFVAANASHFTDASRNRILKGDNPVNFYETTKERPLIYLSSSLVSPHSQMTIASSPMLSVISSFQSVNSHSARRTEISSISSKTRATPFLNSIPTRSVITIETSISHQAPIQTRSIGGGAPSRSSDDRSKPSVVSLQDFSEPQKHRKQYAKSEGTRPRSRSNVTSTLASLLDFLKENNTLNLSPPSQNDTSKSGPYANSELYFGNISYSNFEDDLASFIAEQERLSTQDALSSSTLTGVQSEASKPNIAVSTAVSMSTSTRLFARSSNRKSERKQTGFQDIISGLVKLLGGKNVHIANGKASSNGSSVAVAVVPSRINHRAPPKLTLADPIPSVDPIPSFVDIRPTTSIRTSVMSTIEPQGPFLTTKPLEDASFPIDPSEPVTELETATSTTHLTNDPPSGPITEWLPALGYPVGNRGSAEDTKPSRTSIRPLSTSKPTPKPVTTTDSWKFKTTEAASTSGTIEEGLLPQFPETEVSYATIAPTKTSTTFKSTSRWLSTKKTETVLTQSAIDPTVTSDATPPLPTGTSQSSDQEGRPSVGTVLSLPKPSLPIGPPTKSGSLPSREPTGSPFVIPVDIQKIRLSHEGESGPILNQPNLPQTEQSVYIDGRKTFFNLMPTETASGGDSTLVNVGIGYSFPTGEKPAVSQGSVSNVRLPQQRPINRPQPARNPQVLNKTPIRIDTCIIGDETACNVQLNETCRVEAGVSSCNCRLGYGRDGLEQGCKPIVGLVVYIKVDRVNTEQISFGPEYQSPASEKYEILEYESKNAVDSAFSLSALAESYAGAIINGFFSVGGKVIINATVNLLESPQTRSPTIKQEIRRGLISVIRQQNQNIGQSRLYIDGPLNPIPGVQDLDECSDADLNDCSKNAVCTNSFGSFKCACLEGFIDKYAEDSRKSGRHCAVCSPQYCNNKGECVVTNGQKECRCQGNYIGARCETDGEVLGVALGASLAALVIIVLTLICLCMWSRRWKRDQQKIVGNSPSGLGNNYSYFNKSSVQADFHLPLEDRIRWPQTADPMDNFYAQPDPIIPGHNPRAFNSSRPPLPTSPPPPSTMHKPLQPLRSLPAPLTNSRSNILDDTDEDDQGNYDSNNTRFHFPRPKSRVSQTGHNNIYYDVSFPNNRDQYKYEKDFGNVNGFPMKNMRPFHS